MTSNLYEQPPNREQIHEQLTEAMEAMSLQINSDLHHRYKQMALVDEKCQLMTNSFAVDYGDGPYAKDNIRIDNEKVEDIEKDWANIQGSSLETWQKNKEKSKSNQLEMVITLLLHKALNENYLVVRSSTYDDYFNGVDNLIVDRQTGEVVCAFDDFNDNPLGVERHQAKEKKLQKKNAEGVSVKYGLTIAKEKIQRQTITDTPIFLLSMNSQEFDALLGNLDFDLESDLNDVEKQALRQFGELLEQEHKTLSEQNSNLSALGGVLKVAGELKRV